MSLFKISLIALLITVNYINAEPTYGYIFNSNQNQKNIPENTFSDKHIDSLIRHNIGLLENKPDTETQELINKFGKQNVLDQIFLNYVFVIESESLSKVSPKEQQTIENGTPIKVDICNEKESCLFNKIFDKTSDKSVISDMKKFYGNEKPSTLAYLYSSQPKSMYHFRDNILGLNYDDDKKIQIVEESTNQRYPIPGTLETCINNIYKKNYSFDFINNKITKVGTKSTISVTKDAFDNLMKDLCSIVELSKMIRKDKEPNLFTFYLKSIKEIERQVSINDQAVIYDLLNIAHKQFTENVKKYFSDNEISGQMLFTNDLQTLQINTVNTQHQESVRILAQAPKAMQGELQIDKDNFQVYVWFPVFMGFVLFYAVVALFTMPLERDTLLYAKFLTVDAK